MDGTARARWATSPHKVPQHLKAEQGIKRRGMEAKTSSGAICSGGRTGVSILCHGPYPQGQPGAFEVRVTHTHPSPCTVRCSINICNMERKEKEKEKTYQEALT